MRGCPDPERRDDIGRRDELTRWYVLTAAPVDLGDIVACSWAARPSGEHRLTPDGCGDLLVTSDGHVVLCGPERTSWTFRLPSGTTAVGVRFRPGVMHALFHLDVSTIVNRRVPFGDIVGHGRAAHLASVLNPITELDDRRRAMVDALTRIVPPKPRTDAFAERCLELVAAHPSVTQSDIAVAVGLTPRQTHRRSLQTFGYGISTLTRILRFQRFLALAATATGSGTSLAAFAVDAGYADHAHLSRDCRQITGLTPTAFLRGYFSTFPDMSDPYKTARRFRSTIGR